ATRAYCWDGADTGGWEAGAVTTSGDADDDGRWGPHRIILSGWSRSGPVTGGSGEASAARDTAGTEDGRPGLARVAFVDRDAEGGPTYTWVLLAVPVEEGADYRALASSVSGMVWYQDKLLVTADRGDGSALYVYDIDRVQRATVAGPADGPRPAPGTYCPRWPPTGPRARAPPSRAGSRWTAAPRRTAWWRTRRPRRGTTGRPGCGGMRSAWTRCGRACSRRTRGRRP